MQMSLNKLYKTLLNKPYETLLEFQNVDERISIKNDTDIQSYQEICTIIHNCYC